MLRTGFYFFLLLSFIEGAAVMGAELLGAKMLAPFFGSSLYVWSSVMAITLGGLAAGYFAGGIISSRESREKNLYVILLFAAVFTMLMPFSSKIAFMLFGQMDLIPAVIISSLLILFPPVFLMGMVSPMIIANITSEQTPPGRAAGTVYAVSTVGGILATFVFGFVIIPEFGLTKPSYVTGIVLGILPLIQLFRLRSAGRTAALFLFFCFFAFYWMPKERAVPYLEVVYTSEGLLGQIMVVDFPMELYTGDSTRKGEKSRWLFVNRVSQTMYHPEARAEKGEDRYFTYVERLVQVADTFRSDRKKALLLGLGGGIVAKELHEKGFEVEACELDSRIVYVAREFFGLPPEVVVNVDDARHYINKCRKKYDVVIFDTFKGEETPSHVFTLESLDEVKSILNPGGIVLVNSFGFISGKEGLGIRSVYNTFLAAGFKTVMWPTTGEESQRNIVFVASLERLAQHPGMIDAPLDGYKDGVVLVDEYPHFEKINAAAALAWRRQSIRSFYKDYLQREIPVFE